MSTVAPSTVIPSTVSRLQRMNRGSHFRAYGLHGEEAAAQIDPFLAVDHAWISAPTFPPHPHAGFSAVSSCFSTRKPASTTGIRLAITT